MKDNKREIFFAFELPDNTIRTIESLQHTLQRNLRGPMIKWTGPDSWHVKTHHVGLVSNSSVQNLKDAMSLFRKEPVEFAMWSLSIFPNIESPKKIVLKLADPSGTGFMLHGSHIPILLREAVSINPRPWEPHITLGRITPGRKGFNTNLSEIHVPKLAFKSTKLTLFESNSDTGVRYKPIRRLSLPRT